MTTPEFDHHPDEERTSELLKLAEAGAAAPDAAELERIGQLAAAAFGEAFENRASSEPVATGDAATVQPPPTTEASKGNGMKTLALLASSIVVAASLWLGHSHFDANASAALGDVIERLNDSSSLQLKVTLNNETANVWIRQPGLVRWEESADRFQIARGSKLWRIDGATGEYTGSDNPWSSGGAEGVDVLSLLDVPASERAGLLSAKPSGYEDYLDRYCRVYRHEMSLHGRDTAIEAFVDVDSQQLLGIVARDRRAGATGPPLAELTLVALNPEVDESKFRVPMKLADDGRIGKVTDQQGIVLLRPIGVRRWTPLHRQLLIRPGDWVRTELRGANAVTLTLTSQVVLTLGPGSLIELVSPDEARLHAGEVQVHRTEQAANEFRLTGPGSEKVTVADVGKTLYRLDRKEKLTAVKGTPVWLAGYEGTSANDSIGSLIVNVNGQSEPLSVGEHHVTVEIRDQIARTTIEETFVNHTANRLEGIFHFPLPQDASISGFGMWIGGELIEADVVEKQRAREIYETILREKRDPGLLEWTGGNIFKARVFPIEAHSEKRIKITYTQVLPLRGNKYRYSYALKSEMLVAHPLRELSITTLVNSAIPLRSVESPTHTVRTQLTGHSARLEFSAQEYTPTKDFEVVCEIDRRENDVVVIPHRRGDDGYFLMQLTPPTGAGNWQREVIPDGEPLELLLLCDTSGSMDSSMRENQRAFVLSLLSSLGGKDRFNLAVCDVDTQWAFDEFVASNDDHIGAVRTLLDGRVSLGWSDLARAFETVSKKVGKNTQVIYVGDGVVTTATAEPAEFANRLKRMFGRSNATFHAVSVGSSYESVVLKAIASIGGGSMRRISGEQTPEMIAFELLNEIAQPGLRDVQVEFRGVKVAAVYPEQLPNIPAGTQQILVGRYLPEGADQKGEVIVSGKLNGKPVRYAARIELKDAEHGNSFIPRLWARGHLDRLLQQGSGPMIQDEIIALSEEFHIITPYTSLLVLESDADRERFGVKRRFEMRDGERFFAEGRDNANYELRQQQMKLAAEWRLGLRRQVLAQLAKLGRHANVYTPLPRRADLDFDGVYLDQQLFLGRRPSLQSASEKLGEQFFAPTLSLIVRQEQTFDTPIQLWDSMAVNEDSPWSTAPMDEARGLPFGDYSRDRFQHLSDITGEVELQEVLGYEKLGDEMLLQSRQGLFDASTKITSALPAMSFQMDSRMDFSDHPFANESIVGASIRRYNLDGLKLATSPDVFFSDNGRDWDDGIVAGGMGGGGFGGQLGLYRGADFSRRRQPVNPIAWVNSIFPALATPPKETPAEPPESTWNDEAIELSKSLLRKDALAKLTGGVELHRTTQVWHDGWDRLVPNGERTELYSPKSWATLDAGQGQQRVLNWCDAMQRGVLSESLQLGRVRESADWDRNQTPIWLNDASLTAIHENYRNYDAQVEHPADNRAVLVLTYNYDKLYEFRLTIDTERHVLLENQSLRDGKVTQTTTFSEFVEAAGMWWSTKSVTTGKTPDEVQNVVTQTVTELDADAFAMKLQALLAPRESALLVHLPLPKLTDAKLAARGGTAGFEDRFVLLLHACVRQKWDEAFEQLRELETLAADKAGMVWIRISVERTAGRNDDARQRLEKLITAFDSDELWPANYLLSTVYPICDWNEYSRYVAQLKPVYERQADAAVAMVEWKDKQAQVLQSLDRVEEWLALLREIATDMPGDAGRQTSYANTLAGQKRAEEGLAWLREQLAKDNHWSPPELEALRRGFCNLLERQSLYVELLAFLEKWIAEEPASSDPYARYLTALIFNDRGNDAEARVAEWLKQGQAEGTLEPPAKARLDAAVSYALGEGRGIRRYGRADVKWRGPLLETAQACGLTKDRLNVTSRIINHNVFSNTDEGDRLRGVILGWLKSDAATLPSDRIQAFLNWVGSNRLLLGEGDAMEIRNVTQDEWTQIADVLLKRWEDEADKIQQGRLEQPLVWLFANKLKDRYLPFLRRLVAEASDDERALRRLTLFNQLLAQPWTEEIEAEAFALLPLIDDSKKPFEHQHVVLGALLRFVDAMISRRNTALTTAFQDEGKTDELTRTERAAKQAEFLKAAREGVADRLRQAIADRAFDDDWMLPWLTIERTWIDMQLDRNHEEILQACWGILGDAPPKIDPGAKPSEEELRAEVLKSNLRQRAFVTVMNLAARRNAEDALIDRVLAYIDAGIADGKEAGKTVNRGLDEEEQIDLAAGWKSAKYAFLIVLDRPDELERQMREWIRTEKWTIPWRLALARLRAEQGDLPDAISIFEEIEREDELSAADYGVLQNWYLANDQRAKYDRSRLERFEAMNENVLSRYLYNRGRGQGPTELDETTLFVLRALFEKTASPGNYYGSVNQLYTRYRDFRLLKEVPRSVLGKSRQQIYSALQNMESQVLVELRNEATADELVETIAALRADIQAGKVPQGADPNERSLALDLRALDLMEFLIEQKAAAVQNQPGPHADKALAAIRRAFDRAWQPGERRQMSALLASLGNIRPRVLAIEHMTLLKELYDGSEAGTVDRLRIGLDYAQLLYHHYNRARIAMPFLEAAINEYAAGHDGRFPQPEIDVLFTYSSLLQSRGNYLRAESEIERFRAKADGEGEQRQYVEHLNNLHLQALFNEGRTSLGEKTDLYHNLVERVLAQARQGTSNELNNRVNSLVSLYEFAVVHKYEGAKDDLLAFANTTLPELLKDQVDNYSSMIGSVADAIAGRIGLIEGMEFLLTQVENWPGRVLLSGQDPWEQHAYRLANWRFSAHVNQPVAQPKRLAAVEERLLPLVLRELRRDLESQQQHRRDIYSRGHTYYWSDKKDDFRKVAEGVLKEHKDSPRTLVYVADYLYTGLVAADRAIEVLMIAHRKGLLDASGIDTLIGYLFDEKRYAEAIVLLEASIDEHPLRLDHRVKLMEAYFHTNRGQQLDELIAATDALFHQKGRWNEGNINSFATGCLKSQRYEAAAGYFEEAINLRQRATGGRTSDWTLSEYYMSLASAYSGLGKTKEAVDAAAGAVVVWSNNQQYRTNALNRLKQIMNAAADLDDYIAGLDREAETTGQDSPILRKALGEVFQSRLKYQRAIEQFRLAAELQPFDREVHQHLRTCYVAMDEKKHVIEDYLAQIDFDRHNLQLYRELAEATKSDDSLSERAATSIVESAPNEAENHQALAKFRQAENRWSEAIVEWQRVAELRKLEPTGLLGLAKANIHERRWKAARENLDKLRKTDWPKRFNKLDEKVRELEKQISAGE